MKKYGFIYLTTNLINGKKYIGQRKYRKGWESYLGSGVHLKNAIKKYGRENFQRIILEECKDKYSLDKAEEYWINKYNAVKSEEFYNIAKGGTQPSFWDGKTEEEKIQIRKNLSDSHKGIKLTPESIQKQRETKLRRYGNSAPWQKGRKLSEEHKAKLRNHKGVNPYARMSEKTLKETKIKQSEAKLGKYVGAKHWNSKKVINLDTLQVYESIGLVAKEFNMKNGTHIVEVCKGKRNKCKGYRWMYYDEYLEETH